MTNVIKSINPATLEINGEVKENTEDEIISAFSIAQTVQKDWSKLPIAERALRVGKVTNFIVSNFDKISLVISNEVGKPPNEAFIAEVYGAMDSTFLYYHMVTELLEQPKEIPLGFYNSLDKQSIIMHKPRGVVAVIGPYNYPFIIPFEQITQSLMAGNAVVFKPSSSTVLTGKMIQDLYDQTDLPKGLLQTVYGNGSTVGNILIDKSDLVIFTGSTETGKKIMRRAADTLKPVILELGGKSAMIVMNDANIERAVYAARWGCFTNSGQVCSSVKRLYVHKDIYDVFIPKLVELTKQLKQGIPTEPEIDVGAIVNEEQLKIIENTVEIGINEGAKVLCGGRRNPNLKGYFYEPTILADVTNRMQEVQKEIFGPVLVVIKFDTEQEVIEMVNDNPYGLTSSVWTKDIEKGKRIGEQINTGTIMINECVYTFALAATPWGGNKMSGLGRTHGEFGFHSVTRPLHMNIDTSVDNDMWWMPYNEAFDNMMENFKLIASRLSIK